MSKRARQTRKSEMGGESKMSKASAATTIALAIVSLFIAGCATKEYVRQAITPIDKKVDQVDQSSQKRDSAQVSDINKTNQVVDEDEKKLDATSEIAKTADNQSKGAMSKANQNAKDLSDLRAVVANIDEGKGKKAREASRRVEITVYTAKPLSASATGAN